ncbi:MAG: hypothetical protein ABI114_11310, partial [Rhodanobacter sp.]
MSPRSTVPFSRGALGRAFVVMLLCAAMAACGRGKDGDKPVLQSTPASSASAQAAAASKEFSLVSASADSRDTRTALVLQFNRILVSAQEFDKLIAVTGPNGEVVSGSWS